MIKINQKGYGMMSKAIKSIMISLAAGLVIFLFLMIIICRWVLTPGEKRTVIETSYGDVFNLSYDSYRNESLIEDTNSRFNLVLKGEVTSEDFIEIQNPKNIKVYKLEHIIFYDMGNGFERFYGDLAELNSVYASTE